MKVKLSDIIETLEMTDRYSEYFLDRKTGEIVWINEMGMDRAEMEDIYERLDEHGFYRFPTSFDIREYNMMEDFIETLPAPVENRLGRTIQGKGAFRRFKGTIRQLGVDEQWYQYQTSAYRKIAIEWCEENGLEYE